MRAILEALRRIGQLLKRLPFWADIASIVGLLLTVGLLIWPLQIHWGCRGVNAQRWDFTIPSISDEYYDAWYGKLSSDGKLVAFTGRERDGVRSIFVRSVDDGKTWRLPGARGEFLPFFWDAFGKAVFFVDGGTPWRCLSRALGDRVFMMTLSRPGSLPTSHHGSSIRTVGFCR